MNRPNAREHVRAWIDYERQAHADVKYGEDTPIRKTLIEDVKENPHLEDADQGFELFIGNYLARAKTFGLSIPQGRQAMGKLIVTLLHALETSVELHGPMPKPGVPSGEVVEWEGDTHA